MHLTYSQIQFSAVPEDQPRHSEHSESIIQWCIGTKVSMLFISCLFVSNIEDG